MTFFILLIVGGINGSRPVYTQQVYGTAAECAQARSLVFNTLSDFGGRYTAVCTETSVRPR